MCFSSTEDVFSMEDVEPQSEDFIVFLRRWFIENHTSREMIDRFLTILNRLVSEFSSCVHISDHSNDFLKLLK